MNIKEKIKNYIEENKITKRRVKTVTVDYILLFIACSFGTFATVSVMLPNGLTSGGLTGLVRIIQHYVPLSFTGIYYLASFAIVVFLSVMLGFREAKKTILLSIMYPTTMLIWEKLNIQFLDQKDILLAAVFYGVFAGICSGIVIWRGYSFSGTDAIAKVIRKKLMPQMTQGKILVAIDTSIIIVSALIFGRNIALYALITQAIVSKVIDVVLFGVESNVVQVEIITRDKTDEIVNFIMEDMHRGATTERVTGEYTKERYKKIRVFCSPRESIILKKQLAELDPTAFVSLIQVDSLYGHGKGFKNIKDDK